MLCLFLHLSNGLLRHASRRVIGCSGASTVPLRKWAVQITWSALPLKHTRKPSLGVWSDVHSPLQFVLMAKIISAAHHVTLCLCFWGSTVVAPTHIFASSCLAFPFLLSTCQASFPPLRRVQVPLLREAVPAHLTDGYYLMCPHPLRCVFHCRHLSSFEGFLENSSLSPYYRKHLYHKCWLFRGNNCLRRQLYLLAAQCYFCVLKGKISIERDKLLNVHHTMLLSCCCCSQTSVLPFTQSSFSSVSLN